MGTTSKDKAGENGGKEDKADVAQIKKDIHQRARDIVSSLPLQFLLANKICNDAPSSFEAISPCRQYITV